jgi:hypothetical protein
VSKQWGKIGRIALGSLGENPSLIEEQYLTKGSAVIQSTELFNALMYSTEA